MSYIYIYDISHLRVKRYINCVLFTVLLAGTYGNCKSEVNVRS